MNKILVTLVVCAGVVTPSSLIAEPATRWALNTSIQRVLKVAPEMKSAEAEVSKQKAKLKQIKAWPNPRLGIQVDNTLGLENSAGGYDVTQLSISQPLSFGRLRHQRRQAAAGLARLHRVRPAENT